MSVAPRAHDWAAYCNGVNDKRIFADEAGDHVARLREVVPLRATDVVLDFGCGFGYVLVLLARHVGRVAYWDAAANVLRRAGDRVAHLPHVEMVDLAEGRPAPDRIYDLVLVNSVVQYMQRAELAGWLARWRSMLRDDGRLVVSDVPTPDLSTWEELTDMLAFAERRGFLWAAVRDGFREAGRYARTRRRLSLLCLTPDELAALAMEAGLSPELLPANLTHRSGRFSMLLRPLPT